MGLSKALRSARPVSRRCRRLKERGGEAPGDLDMIFLYRRPILDHCCETGEDLRMSSTRAYPRDRTPFGFSDEDMDRLENSW